MSEQPKPQRFTYQQRCLVQSVKHTAYGIGCLALGDGKGAAAHGKAAAAWAAVAMAAQAAVSGAANKVLVQWLLDATWVEPLDYLDGMPEEFESVGN